VQRPVEVLEENPADTVSIYRVPADSRAFEPPADGLFRPAPAPLARRTPAADAEALRDLRRAALRDLDELLLDGLEQVVRAPANGYEIRSRS
jgi:hypothetical protein